MDLITIDEYKQAKALTSSKEDERLGIIVPAVSQLVKTYCGTSFIDYVNTDKEDLITVEFNDTKVMLEESPVLEILEVSERTSPLETYTQLTSDQFILNKKTDTVTKVCGYWAKGIESVRVIYNAGYVATPAEVKLALIDLIYYYMKEEYKVSRMSSAGSLKNTATSTLVGNLGFPDHIKRVLDMYRII